jgi:hypothetical protein
MSYLINVAASGPCGVIHECKDEPNQYINININNENIININNS